jgi:peptidoglycan/xylan/chitin deacetylase (PgdA/CDA1 family)
VNPLFIEAPALLAVSAAGVTAYGAAYPRSQIFGSTVCRTSTARKLALTFDDGPNPAITPRLLDLLDRYDAQATFFLIGSFVRSCPDLVKEIIARGHVIGNHTQTHPNLFKLSPMKILNELRLCHEAIAGVVGTSPRWFRPPFGMRNPWVVPAARELGYQTVMWTLIPGDWREKPVDWLKQRMSPIARHAENIENAGFTSSSNTSGDILCLHDGSHAQQNGDRTRTLAALEHWLPRWRDLGLQFVTIDDAVTTPAT